MEAQSKCDDFEARGTVEKDLREKCEALKEAHETLGLQHENEIVVFQIWSTQIHHVQHVRL